MLTRTFLVHNCFNPTSSFEVWKDQQAKRKCSCKLRLNRNVVEDWLDEGIIQPIITGWNNLGEKPSPQYSEDVFCFTRRAARTPRVATVEEEHIQRAYVDNQKWAQDRINEWGKLAHGVIESLMVPWRDDPFEGRCLFLNEHDDRTSVGRNVEAIIREE